MCMRQTGYLNQLSMSVIELLAETDRNNPIFWFYSCCQLVTVSFAK